MICEGDDLFMLVQTFDSAPASEKTFEAHQHYADIQYIVSGRETIYYQPTATPFAQDGLRSEKGRSVLSWQR